MLTHALRVVLAVEEADGHRRPEEEPRHHVARRRARVGPRPAEDANGAEGADAGAAHPRVDRARDALLGEGREVARLDHGEQHVRDPAGQAGDEKGEDVGDGAVGVAEVHPADDRHEEQVVEHVVGVELEREHVVDVHADDEAGGPIGARREGKALAVLDAHRRGRVACRVHEVGHAQRRDHKVAQRVQQEPARCGQDAGPEGCEKDTSGL